MIPIATTSVHRLARGDVDKQSVMDWSCPVPYFGLLRKSRVASLGINPSKREFVDATGRELDGSDRRFPTLGSLGLSRWSEASSLDVSAIVTACDDYFLGNPYDQWFRTLDAVISRTGASYYSAVAPAVHLDLVPYATHAKWSELKAHQQRALLDCCQDLLGGLLRDSTIDLLVLNGRSVVREFERASGFDLNEEPHSGWDLLRGESRPVLGMGYHGEVERIGSVELGRPVSILGFNHNLQSSFGVTRRALGAIADWIGSRRRS